METLIQEVAVRLGGCYSELRKNFAEVYCHATGHPDWKKIARKIVTDSNLGKPRCCNNPAWKPDDLLHCARCGGYLPDVEVISKVEVIDMCHERLRYTLASNALNEIVKELKGG